MRRLSFLPAALAAAAVVALLPAAASAQVRLSGYLAAEYLQGQSQSAWSVPTFGNVQAGLILSSGSSASASTSLGYKLEIRSRGLAAPEIEQAWAGFSWSAYAQARVGVYLVPFGRYNAAARPYETFLIDEPYGTTDTRPRSWRDIGVMVEGDVKFLKYAAFIGNGLAEADSPAEGQSWRDNNVDKGWGWRLALPISSELDVAVSYYQGDQDGAGERGLRIYGADAGWATQNILAQAEYTRTDIDNPAGFEAGRIEGWYVLLGLSLGSFRPAASYQTSKADDVFHGPGWAADPPAAGEGLSWNHSRWTMGLAYVLSANIQIKLEYDWQKEKGAALKDNVLRVQAAAQF
jgi:hypothetical protein